MRERPLYQPAVEDQITAIYVLLASSIHPELRRALREREYELATRKEPQ